MLGEQALGRKITTRLGVPITTQYNSEKNLIKRDWRYTRELAYYSSIGLQVALSILIGYGVGWYLDAKWQTYPWLTVLFFIFGIAAAGRNIGLAIKKLRNY
jgi:ATP synthase protein I